jgi:AcrR family transcriptional regulator
MPRVKHRTTDLRARGVAAALDVLTEAGVAGLTTRTVANRAGASVPAIYEVFGDKAGLVREVFFEGFRRLGEELNQPPQPADPLDGLRTAAEIFRRFIVENPVLAQIMFSQPFATFDPSREESKAGHVVRMRFLDLAQSAVEEGHLAGDPTDIAHLVFAVVQGLAAAESAKRLGGSRRSVDRRFHLGIEALLSGLRVKS